MFVDDNDIVEDVFIEVRWDGGWRVRAGQAHRRNCVGCAACTTVNGSRLRDSHTAVRCLSAWPCSLTLNGAPSRSAVIQSDGRLLTHWPRLLHPCQLACQPELGNSCRTGRKLAVLQAGRLACFAAPGPSGCGDSDPGAPRLHGQGGSPASQLSIRLDTMRLQGCFCACMPGLPLLPRALALSSVLHHWQTRSGRKQHANAEQPFPPPASHP